MRASEFNLKLLKLSYHLVFLMEYVFYFLISSPIDCSQFQILHLLTGNFDYFFRNLFSIHFCIYQFQKLHCIEKILRCDHCWLRASDSWYGYSKEVVKMEHSHLKCCYFNIQKQLILMNYFFINFCLLAC